MSIISSIRGAATAGLLAIGLTAAVSATAFAHDQMKLMMEGGTATVGDLELTGAWTRATPPTARAGGGYLTIKNNGAEADTLVAGSVTFAKRTEIHEMAVIDNVMKMRELEAGLEIPAGGTAVLKPGGYHVMFMGLDTGLTQGDVVEVKLTFKKAGEVTIKMPVAAIGAKTLTGEAGKPMDHSKMDHGKMDHGNMSHDHGGTGAQ